MLACSLHVVQDRREWYCLGAESDPESSRLLIIITISDPVSQRTVLLLQNMLLEYYTGSFHKFSAVLPAHAACAQRRSESSYNCGRIVPKAEKVPG